MTKDEKSTNFETHLTEVAAIALRIGERLGLKADAQQACFATILISADKHGVWLDSPQALPPNGSAAAKDAAAAAKADAQIKDAPKHATPEQAEAAARKVLIGGVKRACLLLNQEGFTPALSSIAKDGKLSTLDQYIEKETQLEKTFAEFDNEDLEALIKNLSLKLDTFRANRKGLEDEAGF